MKTIKTHIFKDGEEFDIGPFHLIPRQCTHSVIGSFGFDISVSEKTVTHMSDNKLTGMTEETRERNLISCAKSETSTSW